MGDAGFAERTVDDGEVLRSVSGWSDGVGQAADESAGGLDCGSIGVRRLCGGAVGAVVGKHKVAKHFQIEIGEAQFAFRRKPDAIAREARLDGVYVVRTSVPAAALDADETVQAYKDLARVDIDQTWRLSRIKGWRVWVNAGKQGATEWQGCRASGFEFGDGGRVRGDEFVEGPEHFDRAAA